MNIYEARWRNAQKVVRRIQALLDRGYIVRDKNDEKVHGFKFTDNGIYQTSEKGACLIILFENDKEWDHGLFTPIAEWNAKVFGSWKCYKPEHVRPVIRITKEIQHELAKPVVL